MNRAPSLAWRPNIGIPVTIGREIEFSGVEREGDASLRIGWNAESGNGDGLRPQIVSTFASGRVEIVGVVCPATHGLEDDFKPIAPHC